MECEWHCDCAQNGGGGVFLGVCDGSVPFTGQSSGMAVFIGANNRVVGSKPVDGLCVFTASSANGHPVQRTGLGGMECRRLRGGVRIGMRVDTTLQTLSFSINRGPWVDSGFDFPRLDYPLWRPCVQLRGRRGDRATLVRCETLDAGTPPREPPRVAGIGVAWVSDVQAAEQRAAGPLNTAQALNVAGVLCFGPRPDRMYVAPAGGRPSPWGTPPAPHQQRSPLGRGSSAGSSGRPESPTVPRAACGSPRGLLHGCGAAVGGVRRSSWAPLPAAVA